MAERGILTLLPIGSSDVVKLTFLMITLTTVIIYFCFKYKQPKVKPRNSLQFTTSGFRKRDKLAYYAYKFGRKFRQLGNVLKDIQSPHTRRKVIVEFVKRYLFNREYDVKTETLDLHRLPESFFEPDEDNEDLYLDDLKLISNAIRVFGHLENSVLYRFYELFETVTLQKGEYVFHIGEQDENVYVVISGRIQLSVIDSDGLKYVISEVTRGDGIDSFLSVLNVLTGNTSTLTTVEAVAVEPSCLLKLPTLSFLEVCQPHSPDLLRLLQMTCIRLQRLTFTAVCSHLGLGLELMKQDRTSENQSKAVEYFTKLQTSGDIVYHIRSSQSDYSKALADGLAHLVSKEDTGNIPCTSRKQSSLSNKVLETRGALQLGEAPQRGSFMNKSGTSASLQASVRQRSVKPVSARYSGFSNTDETADDSAEQLRASYRRSKSVDIAFHLADRDQSSDSDSVDEPQFGSSAGRSSLTGQSNGRLSSLCASTRGGQPIPGISSAIQAELIDKVKRDIAEALELSNLELLAQDVALVHVPCGTILSREGDMVAEIYFIISGELLALQSVIRFGTSQLTPVHTFRVGDFVGLLAAVTAEPNVCTWRTGTDCLLAALSHQQFYAIVRQNPQTLFAAVRHICGYASPLLHQLDFALQWTSVGAGKALYKKGDVANHVYVLLGGRLRQVDNLADGSHRVAGELGRGAFFGHLEVICSIARVHTVIAIRDSELVQIPGELLRYIKLKVPQVMTRLVHLLSTRLLGNLATDSAAQRLSNPLGPGAPGMLDPGGLQVIDGFTAASDSTDAIVAGTTGAKSATAASSAQLLTQSSMSNLRTVAILPVSSEINAEAFTLELQHSMTPIGSSIRLTSTIIQKRLGPSALKSVNNYRLIAWLGLQEDLHRIVFFVCDRGDSSAWNRLCIRQADCVLVLALGNTDPSFKSQMEMILRNHPTKVAKALVLMYPSDTDYPLCRHTAQWLNVRPWISHHYHVRCEKRVFSRFSPERLVAFYEQVFARERPNSLSDFSRLARYLTGEAIGLVLGGGGARGCSHIGVIQAFQEAGIPIDLVGGTSIGAFMGALWAEETRFAQFVQRARQFSSCMTSIWNKLKDFTYPTVSIFSGKEFNNQLEAVFGARQVEDLWIPTFLVTTDITNCKMRIHTQGSVWRYVRASMSLSGYLPPLCDPYDGSLLLDGGYTNNVPADVMAAFGAKTIFAVDVGASVDTDFTNYGDYLSGWRLLYHRFFKPYSPPVRVPNLTEIQARLAYISCVRQLEKVKASGICHYMRPPIDRYMTLQFSAFDEIMAVGYEYAKEMILRWQENDLLPHLVPGLRVNWALFTPHPSPRRRETEVSPTESYNRSFRLIQPFEDQLQPYIDLADSLGSKTSNHEHLDISHDDAEVQSTKMRNLPAYSFPSLENMEATSEKSRRRTVSEGFDLNHRQSCSNGDFDVGPHHLAFDDRRDPSTDLVSSSGLLSSDNPCHLEQRLPHALMATNTNSTPYAGQRDEDGYLEDDDDSEVSADCYSPRVISDPELHPKSLQDRYQARTRDDACGSLPNSLFWSCRDISSQNVHGPGNGVVEKQSGMNRRTVEMANDNGEPSLVRQRKLHRRSSLDRLRLTKPTG